MAFDDEKKWSNVQSSRSKPKKAWGGGSGVSQEKADAMQSGLAKAAADNPVSKLLGKVKKAFGS